MRFQFKHPTMLDIVSRGEHNEIWGFLSLSLEPTKEEGVYDISDFLFEDSDGNSMIYHDDEHFLHQKVVEEHKIYFSDEDKFLHDTGRIMKFFFPHTHYYTFRFTHFRLERALSGLVDM